MILCGAAAVQVGTCHWTEGPKCFDRICQELKDIMESKGYESIDDFKNKMKEWSKEGVALSREARMKKNKLKKQNITTSTAVKAAPGAENHMVTALLVVVIAFLLADKMNLISI
jgi:hypothetical protein